MNTSGRIHDDLLTRWIDGALTPAEAAEIERNATDELRAEKSGADVIGHMLRSHFPASIEPPSADFFNHSIMQEIERSAPKRQPVEERTSLFAGWLAVLRHAFIPVPDVVGHCTPAMKPARVDEFLFLATNDSIPPAGEHMPVPDADLMEAILGRLDREFRGYSHFHLLGRHSQDIHRENSAWLIPATGLHLQFDAGVAVDECTIKVRVKFSSDGTELLSSASVLSGLRPMLLNGPPWRSGRLVLIALPKRF